MKSITKEIEKIHKGRARCRYWRWKNKDNYDYISKKKVSDKKYYEKTKNSIYRKINRLHSNHSGTRNRISKVCINCNKEFINKNTQKFCSYNCKSYFFRIKYMERDYGIKHTFTFNDWIGLEKKCNICNSHDNITMDHIIPISKSKNKVYNIDDIQALCLSCNSRKRDFVVGDAK